MAPVREKPNTFPRASAPAALEEEALAFLRRRQPERCVVFASWADLEPEENRFDPEAYEALRKTLIRAGSLGAEPVLCLWRGADPAWFTQKGGWVKEDNLRCYLRYAGKTVRTVGHLAGEYITFYEPNARIWQEEEGSLLHRITALSMICCAHVRAVKLIRDTREQRQLEETKGGFVLRMRSPAALRRDVLLHRLPGGGLYQQLPLLAMANGEFRLPLRNALRVQQGRWADFVGVTGEQDAERRQECCALVKELTGADAVIMEE